MAASRPNPYGRGIARAQYYDGPHFMGANTESTLTRGMIRDAARIAIPDGGVYDAADFLLHQPGVAIKRGGTAYAGPALTDGVSPATYALSVAYEDTFSTPLVAVGDNGHLYAVTSTATTDVGTLGSSFTGPFQHPPIHVNAGGSNILVYPNNDGGSSVPKKYNGSTVADLGGSPPAATKGCVYAARLVLGGTAANANRMYFSPLPNIESTWDTTNSYIDFDVTIYGFAALQNALLVFGRDRIGRIIGTTPPPNSDMDLKTISNVGCTDPRSIVLQEGNCLFANPRGVYLTNGAASASLTTEGGIESYWQNLFDGYDPTTWTISAGIIKSFYMVAVLDNTGALVASLMCYVPRRAWWRTTNLRPMMFASSIGAADELYYADRDANRVVALSGIFSPSSSNKNDANGTAVTPLLEYRPVGGASGLVAFGNGHLTYDMRDAASDNPTLAVKAATGLKAASFSTVDTLTETTDATRAPISLDNEAQALTVRIEQSNASSLTEIYGLEVEARPFPATAEVA